MKYIQYTYVDAITGISVASHPATSGPAHPEVKGLEFVWARESAYPTEAPDFFGTCPDSSDIKIDGVTREFIEADWLQMQADEMNARPKPISKEEEVSQAIQAMLDKSSLSRGYDSVISECSYATSTGSFGAEAQVTVDWRDAVWTYAYQVQEDIKGGVRTEPTLADLLAELPAR